VVASAKYAAPVLHGATDPNAGIGPKHNLQEGQQYGCVIRDAIVAKSRVRNRGVRRDKTAGCREIKICILFHSMA